MSKFVIAASATRDDAAIVASIRSAIPEKSIREIGHALSTGGPLLTRELFGNDHDEAAVQLTAVVDALRRHGIEPQIYEISDNTDEASRLDAGNLESVDYLRNVLDRHNQIKRDREGRSG
jgi:hypothetical protein